MAVNRSRLIDEKFIQILSQESAVFPPSADQLLCEKSRLDGSKAIEIFSSMVSSRHLDIHARELKKDKESFYTIGSSGHELNSVVGALSRYNDPAYLHYRSGAFFLQRAKQDPSVSAEFDVLRGMVASSDEPISGGRHKVFGSVPLFVPPQTSTIASHLPKAVGAAFTIARQKRLNIPSPLPEDSIVLCSFGDASSNHSSACGAFNTAALADHQNLPCPILFVCEDNGIGISTRTPKDWLERRFGPDPGLKYFRCDGLDLIDSYRVAKEAITYVRETRRPTFLHIKLIRLMGHAGSDVEQLYRTLHEIENLEAQDPLLMVAQQLIEHKVLCARDILALYEQTRARIRRLGKEAVLRPKITSAKQVMEPLAPYNKVAVQKDIQTSVSTEVRKAFFDRLPEEEPRKRHLAYLLNKALGDILLKYPQAILFGEDVGKKGGVYHVTADLQKKSSVGRVFNTPLDETAILGLAIGAGQWGMLPIPEIQYLAYLHNAIDQIRGEACSQQFFSNNQYQNPMVVRIASYAYQKGFGGHFHNANSIAALRDIPGLIIASPSNGQDAVRMLRTCISTAYTQGRVVIFLEPIALYMTKDLYEDKDGLWSFSYPKPEEALSMSKVGVYGSGKDLCIISYANGLWMSLRVAKRLEQQGIQTTVIDLRWLNPIPEQDLLQHTQGIERILIVDECRKTGGISEAIVSLLAENKQGPHLKRICGLDTYIPLGAAANLVLIQEQDIEDAATQLMEVSS